MLKIIKHIVRLPSSIGKAYRLFMKMRGELYKLHADRLFAETTGFFNGERFVHFLNERDGNRKLHELMSSQEPVMIGRHGAVEMDVAVKFDLENKAGDLGKLCFNAGFFPDDKALAKDWAELYLESSKDIDCLCEMHYRYGRYNEVQYLFSKYSPQASVVNDINILTPFFQAKPWTRALKGQRVLIIHPFVDTIKAQYEKREKLFKNPDMLPEFASLQTIRSVQTSAGGQDPRFSDWFEAYGYLCGEISKVEFDVVLIGCGSYNLPLASYIKRLGKKAVVMGGSVQLLFGIRGQRWDSAGDWIEQGLYNEHWVRPSDEETPQKSSGVEGGCYW